MCAKQARTDLDFIDIKLRGIGDAMKSSWLQVPPYQRDYAWEKDQVEELLGDLAEAIRASESEYFLGSIVVSSGASERQYVTDGQQRLATVSILIAAIRNYFLANGEQERAGDLENEFLLSRDRRTRDLKSRLQLNTHDHNYYELAVLKRPSTQKPPVPDASSHKRLQKAVVIISDYIQNLAKANPKEPINTLLTWVEYCASP